MKQLKVCAALLAVAFVAFSAFTSKKSSAPVVWGLTQPAYTVNTTYDRYEVADLADPDLDDDASGCVTEGTFCTVTFDPTTTGIIQQTDINSVIQVYDIPKSIVDDVVNDEEGSGHFNAVEE